MSISVISAGLCRLRSTWWHIDWNMCERNLWKREWCVRADLNNSATCPPENRSLYALLYHFQSSAWFPNPKFGSYLFKFVRTGSRVCFAVHGVGRPFGEWRRLAVSFSHSSRPNELSKIIAVPYGMSDMPWYALAAEKTQISKRERKRANENEMCRAS